MEHLLQDLLWNTFYVTTSELLTNNRALENLRAMDDFYSTNFLSHKVIGCSTKAPVIDAFAKRFHTNSFRKS